MPKWTRPGPPPLPLPDPIGEITLTPARIGWWVEVRVEWTRYGSWFVFGGRERAERVGRAKYASIARARQREATKVKIRIESRDA